MKIIFLKIYQCTPYLKVPFRIPVKYKVTKAHKIEIPGHKYTQRQLIICLIYTWCSVQDLCYLYHTTIHTPENSKTTGRELFGKWLSFTWVSIIFRIFVRILFGCLLGNLVHLYSSVMPRICSSCSFLFLFILVFFFAFFCFFVSVFYLISVKE